MASEPAAADPPIHDRGNSTATVESSVKSNDSSSKESLDHVEEHEDPSLSSPIDAKHPVDHPNNLSRTASARTDSSANKIFLTFDPVDPGNPKTWSKYRKLFIVVAAIMTVLNSTLSSALPSSDQPKISNYFNVYNDEEEVLPISTYLLGYVLGPLVFAPLSESYGRQIIMIGTFLGFFAISIGLPLAPNWPAFVIFRLIQGTFASSPISVTGGIYADLYENPMHRGRAMACFMTATMFGPIVAPIASGYLQVYSWAWPFWFGLIFAGACLPLVLALPETNPGVVLQRRAARMRKQDPDKNWNVYSDFDMKNTSWRNLFVETLGRPSRMLFTEPLVGLTCLFMSFVYGIFYILLIVFPEIYPPIYGFSLGEQGLAFLGLAVGVLAAAAVYLWWDAKLARCKEQGKAWASREEFRRLPLAAIGGPFFAIGMFWIGWSARPSVHWIVPILGGVPLGFGYVIIFMGLVNYIIDAYAIYAASGLAASAVSRSLFGCVLPFAGTPMYATLGIDWACTLIGCLSLLLAAVPFAFIYYGPAIRARSSFCRELAELARANEAKEKRRADRAAARAATAGREAQGDGVEKQLASQREPEVAAEEIEMRDVRDAGRMV